MKTSLVIIFTLGLLVFGSNLLQAQIVITINGQTSGASIAQGDSIIWIITGLTPGATVNDQMWIDLDSNGVINLSSDVFLVGFSQTDGVSGGDGPPPDMDGSANGTIYTILTGLSFPAGHYIFKTSTGTDSAFSAYAITTMASPTYSISGRVTISGNGVQNVAVRAQGLSGDKNEFYGLTNTTGYYTILTNVISGTTLSAEVPMEDFNSLFSGYVSTPNADTLTLTADVTGVDFVLISGKIITGHVRDTLGNPLVNINVSIYHPSGGGEYNGSTDVTGKYSIAVPEGSYKVQFGHQDQTNGYIVTYYDQCYVPWLSDSIVVTSLADTIKNIDAVLKKGSVITGTVANAVTNGWNIAAFPYNISGNPSFANGFNNSGTYYFMVLPGTYSIQFNRNYPFEQFYYNQIGVFPGTAVTVGAIGDTVRNINADFDGTITGVSQTAPGIPKEFSLSQNYPNPFNPTTVIDYQLPVAAYVTLKIYNVLGKEIATLVARVQNAGSYVATFDGSKFASGVYFYKLQAGNNIQTKKLVLMK